MQLVFYVKIVANQYQGYGHKNVSKFLATEKAGTTYNKEK